MKAKEYLRQLLIINAQINSQYAILEDMKARLESIGSLDYSKDKVVTSPKNSMEDRIIKYIDRKNEIEKKVDEYIDLKYVISSQIVMLENPIHITLLTKRYIEGKKFEKIADEMGYSFDWIRHKHGDALWEFEKKFF